jgi:hypothetical protein
MTAYKSSITGQWITRKEALSNPDTTYKVTFSKLREENERLRELLSDILNSDHVAGDNSTEMKDCGCDYCTAVLAARAELERPSA